LQRESKQSASEQRLRRPVFLFLLLAGGRALAVAINFEIKIAAGRHAACGFFVETYGQPVKNL
jgi:hypothetical protein